MLDFQRGHSWKPSVTTECLFLITHIRTLTETLRMQKVIISDTSCRILLNKIGELNLLNKLFGIIIITQEITDEFKTELPSWFRVENPINKTYQKILEASQPVQLHLPLNKVIVYS